MLIMSSAYYSVVGKAGAATMGENVRANFQRPSGAKQAPCRP